MVISIRPATLDDLPTLLSFEQGVISAERPFDPTIRPDPIHYHDIESLIVSDDSVVAVAQTDGSLIGCGFAKKKASRPYTSPAFHAHLGFMFVVPEHRGKGVNQLILDHLLQWARDHGLSEIRLTVYPENASAVRAYEKAGFAPYILEMRKRSSE